MINRTRLIGILLTLAMLLSSVSSVAVAQDATPQPENHPQQPGEPWQDPETNLWMMSNGASIPAVDGLLSVGGPDDYGYSWDDSVALSWIDATSGTKAGLNTYTNVTGLIPLPFAFKFYENTYTSLYITAFGYVAFSQPDYWADQFELPSPSIPNNLIAPNAAPSRLAASGSTNNQVYYKSGGVAPNRYFAVEWYQVDGYYDSTFTFEVVLHENGDVVFQYQQMTYGSSSYYCNSSGIEDTTGTDGLAYMGFCSRLPSNKAVRIYRPVPAAHVKVSPLTQGRFTKVNQTGELTFTVKNIGELGEDTFELSASSGWPISEFYTENNELLTDTDGDGSIDTGSLAKGYSATVMLFVQTPAVSNVGDNNTVSVLITSSLDPSRSKTAVFQTAIPAPFAQVYEDDADGAMSIDMIQPTFTIGKKVTPDGYYGYEAAVAEMSNGFAYLWNEYYWNENASSTDLEYSIIDKTGKIVRPISKLTENASSIYSQDDYSPAINVTPDGHIGIAWIRSLYNNTTYKQQQNIFFAILDSSGNIVVTPTNLTQNTTWGNWNDLNVPNFYSLNITSTQDNHFSLIWQQEHKETDGEVDDIYYTVKDINGGTIKAVTKLTSDTAGWNRDYTYPSLTALTNNRVLLAWNAYESYQIYLALIVLDSSGNLIANPAVLSNLYANNLDMIQLSTGSILIAGSRSTDQKRCIFYAILNGNDYSPIAGPSNLDNPLTLSGDDYVSVSTDLDGHGILTWMDYQSPNPNLYYALINDDGSVLTSPMIFKSSQALSPNIQTSYQGEGNTSYTLVTPTSSDVDLRLTVPPYSIGKSGSNISISTSIQNLGLSLSGSVTLTATLDPNLTFVESSLTPTSVVGNIITWNLPDLDFQGEGKMTLALTLPNAARGTSYPIHWSLTSTGTEANPSDNTGLTQVIIGEGLYLPFVQR